MPIPVRKLKKEDSYPVDGFTETTKHVILMCGNVDGNANKFYVLELQHNSDNDEYRDYRLYSEYGRIGRDHPARDLREGLSLYDAEKEFERIGGVKTLHMGARVLAATNVIETAGCVVVVASQSCERRYIDAECSRLIGIEGDANLIVTTAKGIRIRHSGYTFKTRYHRVIDKILLAFDRPVVTRFRGNGKPGYNFFEIITANADDWLICIYGVTGNLVQTVHHFNQRPVHFRADDKLQGDETPAVIR